MSRSSLIYFTCAILALFACTSELKAQQYWDGQNMTANNVVDGGTGTWTSSNTNWTTANGSINGTWTSGNAVFTAVQGGTGTYTVTLPASLSATSLTYQVGGYTITGAGTLTLTGSSVFNVVQGADTINAALSGTSIVSKTGSGQLILSGDGSGMTGGVTLSAGSLQASGTVTTIFGTGTLTLSGTTGFQNYLDLNNTTGVNYGNNVVVSGNTLVLSDRGGIGAAAVPAALPALNTFGTLSLSGTFFNTNTTSTGTSTVGLTFGATNLTGNSYIISWAASGTNLVTLGSVTDAGNYNLSIGGNSAVAVTGTTNLGSGNLVVSNTAALTLGGTVTTTGSVVIINGGTLTLGGTGATSAVFQGVSSVNIDGGTLQLGATTGAANVVRLGGTSTPINLAGGNLLLAKTGTTEIEQTGALNLGVGYSTINGNGTGSGNYIISFANLGTVATGATIDFMVGGTSPTNGTVEFGTAPTLINGILGGWATSGNNFATLGASGTNVIALTSYTGVLFDLNEASDPTSNVQLFGSAADPSSVITLSLTGTTSETINSLSLSNAMPGVTSYMVDLSGNNLNLTTGGVVAAGSAYTITDGTLTAGDGTAPASLYFTANSNAFLSLGALMTDNGPTGTLSLVFAGQNNGGLFMLSAANTYTGQTFIEGRSPASYSTYFPSGVDIITDRQLGAEPTSFQADNIVLTDGASLKFTDFVLPSALSANRGITLENGGGSILFGSGEFTNLATPITGTGSMTFAYVGGQTRDIISGANTYDGVTSFIYTGVYFTSIGNVGGTTPTSLGTPTTADNGLIIMNGGNYTSGATYSGVYASTTDRIFEMGNPAGSNGASLGVEGAQILTLNGNIFTYNSVAFGTYGIGAQINGDLIQASVNLSNVTINDGVVRLYGMNNYKGVTQVNQGVLEFNTINNIGAGPSSLGAPDTLANGTIKLSGGNGGAANPFATLRFTGTTAQSTDRPIAAISNGAEELEAMGSAPITFTGGISNQSASFSSNLYLGGTGIGFLSGAGIITDNPSKPANTLSLIMQGITGQSTWTLNQSTGNTYSGVTTINSGNLVLDFSNMGATPTNLINSVSKLTLAGGTLSVLGKSGSLTTSQTFASLTMAADTGSVLNLNSNGGLGVSVVTGTWIRTTTVNGSNFSTLNVISTGTTSLSLTGTLSNNVNGIINWMTYNSTDFATVASGTVTAYTGYQDLLTATPTSTAVYQVTTGGTLASSVVGYGLKIAPTAAGTLTLGGTGLGNVNGQDFSIVFSGANPYSIVSTGTIAVGNGNAAALYISTAGTNALTIAAQLLGNGGATNGRVVKTGSGTLILSGTNTYFDQTDVEYGTLAAGSVTGFSTHSTFNVGASGVLATEGYNIGVLHLTGNGIVENGSSTSGTLTIGGSNTNSGNGANGNTYDSFTGIIEDGSAGALSLVKSGYGWEILNNFGYEALSTYSGNTTINSGYISINVLADAGVASSIGTGNTIYLGSAGQLGVLQVNNTLTFNSESNRSIVLAAGGTGGIDVQNSDTVGGRDSDNSRNNLSINGDFVGALVTLSGDISGAGTLAKLDTGNLDLTGTNTYTGGTVVYGGVVSFGSKVSVPAAGLITVKSGGTAATDYAIDQDFLSHIDPNSTGVIALGSDSSNSLDFTNLSNAALGAITTAVFTGTLTPGSNGYQLGGGAPNIIFGSGTASGAVGSLFFANANTITGTYNVTISPHGTTGASVVFDDTQNFTGTLTVAGAISATYLESPSTSNTSSGALPGSIAGNGYNTSTPAGWMAPAGLVLSGGGLPNATSIVLNPLGYLTMVASATPVDFLPDTAPIYFNGGTLFFANNNQQQVTVGVNYSEHVGAMNLVRGESEVITNQAVGTAQTSTLTFASINRSAGATVDFIGQGLGVNAQNEIVISSGLTSTGTATPWAFWASPTPVKGSNAVSYGPGLNDAATDFAILNSSGAYGTVSAASGTIATNSGTMTAMVDYTVQGTTTTFSADTSVNTIRQNTATGTLALATHTLAVNGLMSVTGLTVGSTVNDGFLTATGSTGGELIVSTPTANTTINSVIKNNGGAVSVVKSGYYNLTLAGSNTFSGGLVVNGLGAVVATNAQALGTGTITLNSGAVDFVFGGATTLNNNWVANADSVLWNGANTAVTMTGSMTLNGTSTTLYLTTDYGAAITLNNTIGGNGNLDIQASSGIVTLSGTSSNTYTGLTIIANRNDGTISNTTVSLEKTGTATAISGNILLGQSSSAGIITTNQQQEILILAASSSGTAVVGDQDQIANTSVITFQGGNGYDAGIFRLNNQSETIGGIQSSTAGDGLIQNNANVSGTTSTLTLQTAAGTNYTFSGLVQDHDNSNSNVSKLAITKTGSGTQTFTNANTYTGGTTISGSGAFFANNVAGSATGTGALTLNAGATLGGTGIITSTINTISGKVLVGQATAADTNTTSILKMTATGSTTFSNANLVFNLSSTSTAGTELALGATPSVLFTGSNSLTFDLQGTGSIANGTQYTLLTTTAGGSGQLGSVFGGLTLSGTTITNLNMNFVNGMTSYSGSYLVLVADGGGYDIDLMIASAVPEPGTWALMLGGLAMLILLQRKRRSKDV